MGNSAGIVPLSLTREEAWELLSRCLRSEDPDDEAFRNALHKLARALRETTTQAEVA